MQPSQPTVAEVARRIVADVAPAQLAEFDFVAAQYARSPAAARRAARPGNEPTASMLQIGGQALGALALGLTADLCKEMLKSGVARARRSRWPRVRRVFGGGRDELREPVPPLAEDQVPAVRQQVMAAVLATGGDAELAESVATALVHAWPRSTS